MSPPVDKVPSAPALPPAADVVVIGGGIAGVSAAYWLARRGHSVALMEKGVIAGEQSSRNWGWCRQQNRDEREIPLIKKSLEIWGGLSEEIGAESSFRRSGLIYVTKDPQELARWERWVTLAQTYQVHSRMLSATEAQALTPGVADRWIGGVHSPSDGKAEPSAAAPAIARAAAALGVTIHQNCAVRALERQAGRVAGVITEHGTVRTSRVLLAAGAWSSMFLRWHGVDLPQAGVRSTAFSTTAAPEVTAGGLSTPGFTLRRRLDGGYTVAIRNRGRLDVTPQGLRYGLKFLKLYRKVRGSDVSVPIRIGSSFFRGPAAIARWREDAISPFEKIRILDPAPDTGIVRDAMAALAAAYPALAGIGVRDAWAGWIDHTPDAVPVIAPIAAIPGLVVATGFSGHGFGIGPAAGRLAADLVTGDAPIVDPVPFRHERLIDGSPIQEPMGI